MRLDFLLTEKLAHGALSQTGETLVRYYLERRDAEFEPKMAEVLCVYREGQVLKKAAAKAEKSKKPVAIVSYDEKPGIQAGAGELREEALDQVEPGAVLGREGKVEAAWRPGVEPGSGFPRNVCGMIVEDQLDRGAGRIGGIEKLEEFDELAAAVAIPDERVDLAGEQIDPGQQAERAMAFVLMIPREARMAARHTGGKSGAVVAMVARSASSKANAPFKASQKVSDATRTRRMLRARLRRGGAAGFSSFKGQVQSGG